MEHAIAVLCFVRNESTRQFRAAKAASWPTCCSTASNPSFMDVAQGVEDEAYESDFSLFICSIDEDPTRERTYLRRLEERGVQGVLITPVDVDDELLDDLPRRATPVVVLDRTRAGTALDHCSVSVDDVLGGRLATQHLLELGHERVAFVGGPSRLGQVADRCDVAYSTLTESGLSRDRLVDIATSALTVSQGREAGSRILGLPPELRPTAAFGANDLVAMGLLQRCVTSGLRVPQDLAIVGYDDFHFAAAASVPLTSVRQTALRARTGRGQAAPEGTSRCRSCA